MSQNPNEIQNELLVDETDKCNKLNLRLPILVLSVIALIATGTELCYYIIKIFANHIKFSSIAKFLFFEVVYALPFLLFFIYILKFYKSDKGKWFIFAIFLIQAIRICKSVYNESLGFMSWVIFVMSILLVISTIVKKYNEIIVSVSAMVFFLGEVFSFFEVLPRFVQGLANGENGVIETFFLYRIMYYIANLTFYIALFLFAAKNNVPSILILTPIEKKKKVKKDKEKIKKINPEQALRILKKNFDSGLITEEEYNAQKEEIMKNL